MKRREIENQLETIASSAAADAAPEAAFIERLASHLENATLREVMPTATRRRVPLPRISWVIAAIVAFVVSVSGAQQIGFNFASHLQPFGQTKTTETTSTTTSTVRDKGPDTGKSLVGAVITPTTFATSTSTSTTTSPPAAGGTEHLHTTTSTTVHTEPTTTTSTVKHTEPSTTTTSTTVVVQTMSLACKSQTSNGTLSVTSTWSPITSANFADYQLIRWSGTDGPSTIVLTTTDQGRTSFTDTGLTQGVSYTYAVVAYAKNGSILGYSKHTPAV